VVRKSTPKKKLPPKKQQPPQNVADVVKRRALQQNSPTDNDLAMLAVQMLLDLPDDVDHHASRAKNKIEILKFLHQLNVDSKDPDTPNDSQLLDLLLKNRK